MKIGSFLWNILNFVLVLFLIIILSWPIIGPTSSKELNFKPNLKSVAEWFFEKDSDSQKRKRKTFKREFNLQHPLGTDSSGKDKIVILSQATSQSLKYASIAVLTFLLFGIPAGLGLAFNNFGRRAKNFHFIRWLIYLVNEWFVKILNSIPVVIVIIAGVLITDSFLEKDWRVYGLMVFFGTVSIPLIAYDIQKTVDALRNQEFIKASEALGVSKMRLIFVDVLWFSCKDIIFSRSMNVFLAAIAIEILKTYYMYSTSISLGRLFNESYWYDYQTQAVCIICIIYFSLRWFTERLIYGGRFQV